MRRAFNADGTAEQMRKSPGNAESQAGTAGTTSGWPFDLPEWIEDPFQLIPGHADASVTHGVDRILTINPGCKLHGAALGELDCVRQEVDQHLAHLCRV